MNVGGISGAGGHVGGAGKAAGQAVGHIGKASGAQGHAGKAPKAGKKNQDFVEQLLVALQKQNAQSGVATPVNQAQPIDNSNSGHQVHRLA